jgi:hypothetical protein
MYQGQEHGMLIVWVLSTLVHKARAISDQEGLRGELKFLHSTFKHDGYSNRQVHNALYPPCREDTSREKPTLVARILAMKTRCMECIIREAVEIETI